MHQNEILLSNKSIEGIAEFVISITPDWPLIIVTGLIGLGSIFTSIAVARISKANQQSQSNGRKAEFRQLWVSEIRKNIAEFISMSILINVRLRDAPNFINSNEYFKEWQQILLRQSTIILMLDTKKEYTEVINSLMEDVLENAVNTNNSIGDLGSYTSDLEEHCANLLEKAWSDIKLDLDDKI